MLPECLLSLSLPFQPHQVRPSSFLLFYSLLPDTTPLISGDGATPLPKFQVSLTPMAVRVAPPGVVQCSGLIRTHQDVEERNNTILGSNPHLATNWSGDPGQLSNLSEFQPAHL